MFDFDQPIDRTHTGSLKWDRYADRDVLPFWVADMDFHSAPPVMEALHERVDHGVFGYTIPDEEVNAEVLRYLRERHGVEAEADWLFWLPGLVPALNLASRAYAVADEGVMTCTPVYPPFLSAPGWSGRTLQKVPLHIKNDEWTFDMDALEAAVTEETRLFILCNPHNPVGRVYRREELEQVADFCARHDLVLCSDEIHCDMILNDGLQHIPTLSLGDEVAARTVTLMAPSKTYNLPGLACAYAVIPDAGLRDRFKRTARGLITEINAFGYVGCGAAYAHGEPWRKELMAYLVANRDTLYAFIADRIPELKMLPMEATYLAWIDVSGLDLPSPARFFEDHGVGLSKGVDFGMPGYLRLNFGCPRDMLVEGLERMERAVQTLREKPGA